MHIRARTPMIRGRGMGQTSITESLLNFLQDMMGQIQAGGTFPVSGTVTQVLTWGAGQYCNAHSGIEPACGNIASVIAQAAGPYANLPATAAALAAYVPRTGPVTYASGSATPINWQQYYTPPATSAPAPAASVPVTGVFTGSDPGIAPAGTSANSLGITIPSWFTDPTQSLIPNVPNWGLVAGAVVALFLFSGKH